MTASLKGAVALLRSGTLGQGVRFVIAGCTVGVVYIGTTTVLADVVGLPFQAALAIGFSFALMVHFTLQRLFVWTDTEEFALAFHHQVGRYLLAAGAQYGLTAAATSQLPSLLGVPTEVVYVVTVGVLACTNFLVFRHGIFHAKAPAPAGPVPFIPAEEQAAQASPVPFVGAE